MAASLLQVLLPRTRLLNLGSKKDMHLSLPFLSSISCRGYSSFATGISGASLWSSVTGVSNAGRKRGRGKNAKRRQDLNRGQRIGFGRAGISFPGLTGPSLVGSKRINMHQSKVNFDESEKKQQAPIRKHRERIPPLQRGYSGRRVPGTSIGPPDSIYDYTFENFDTKVLEYKLVSHMTGNLGRRMRISACVVTGNKNGLAVSCRLSVLLMDYASDLTVKGFAVGKAPMGKAALRKAKNMAAQRLQHIDLYNGHTVFHNFAVTEGCTTVFVQKMPKGFGLDCHRVIKTLCETIGIQDLHVKVEGRTSNIQNVVKAFFRGLMEQESHQQLADRLTLHVVEYRNEFNSIPILVASPQQGYTRSEPYSEEAFDFDNIYYKDGKIPLKKVDDPMAVHTRTEGLWKHYLNKSRDRNQWQARFLRNIYGLEPSFEEMKQRMRPLK